MLSPEKVREALKEKRIKQTEFAPKIGISTIHLNRFLKGKLTRGLSEPVADRIREKLSKLTGKNPNAFDFTKKSTNAKSKPTLKTDA